MEHQRGISGVDDLIVKGRGGTPITLLYRANSLYTAVSADIVRILMSLGFQTCQLTLDGQAHTNQIRHVARSIIDMNRGRALVLPDYTCWRALTNDHHFDPYLMYPFGHLDMLMSDAVIASMFTHTVTPLSLNNIDTIAEEHFKAITSIFRLIKSRGFGGNCHIVQAGLAEHGPFVVPLIQALVAAGAADEFPPDRTDVRIRAICKSIENGLALKIQEAIQQADIRATIHTDELTIPLSQKDLVICDLHYAKSHPKLGKVKVCLLPLGCLVAQACELNLLPVEVMHKLITALEKDLRCRCRSLVLPAENVLSAAK